MTTLYTIGFTQKSAEQFFGTLTRAGVGLVADVRLNNTGQLAGFTKRDDLRYFLGLLGIEYEHWTLFAPTKEMRDRYHSSRVWADYEKDYCRLIETRRAVSRLDTERLRYTSTCLLCSEPTAERCHRRVAAQLISATGGMSVVHL
jgi:uncharacterized protein (DUF488 family)